MAEKDAAGTGQAELAIPKGACLGAMMIMAAAYHRGRQEVSPVHPIASRPSSLVALPVIGRSGSWAAPPTRPQAPSSLATMEQMEHHATAAPNFGGLVEAEGRNSQIVFLGGY